MFFRHPKHVRLDLQPEHQIDKEIASSQHSSGERREMTNIERKKENAEFH